MIAAVLDQTHDATGRASVGRVGDGLARARTKNPGELARMIMQRRMELGWTQERLADEMGRTRGYVSRLESGDYTNPSSKTLTQLARALQMPTTALVRAASAGHEDGGEDARAAVHLVHPRAPADILRETLRQIEQLSPILVREVQSPASAGPGAGVVTEAELWEYNPDPGSRQHDFIAVPVAGTCMDELRPGDRAIVDVTLASEAQDGDVVLAVHDDEWLIKRLQRRDGGAPLLVADDGSTAVLVDGDRTRVHGVVVSSMRRIGRRRSD